MIIEDVQFLTEKNQGCQSLSWFQDNSGSGTMELREHSNILSSPLAVEAEQPASQAN